MKRLFRNLTLFAATLALAGCGHSSGDGHGHEAEGTHAHDDGHGHKHDAKLLLTAYGDRHEAFAEADPLSVGTHSHITARLTLLDTFKPLGKGRVTATLTSGGKKVSKSLEAPSRPGVYVFELTPAAAGPATLTITVEGDGGEDVIAFEGLTVYDNAHKAHHAAEGKEPSSPNGAAFSKEMSWKVDFATAEAQLKPFGDVIRTTARIEPSQGQSRLVTARTSGVVTFAKPLAEGLAVGAGEALFRIDGSVTPDNNLRLQLREAESNYNLARRELERTEKLAAEKLVSDSELLQARNALERAEATYRHLKENFGGGAAAVGSPIGGYVTSVDVANGQYVEAGQTLATVAQTRDLYLKAEIPSRYARRLSSVAGANIRPMDMEEPIDLGDLQGGVVSVGKSVAEGGARIPVTFRIVNKPGLVAGEFVDMNIRTLGGEPVVTVPSQSILEEMGRTFVYVQLTPEYFEKRPVTIGRTDGFETEIRTGLEPGERVVSRGAVMVKLAQGAGALDAHAGHVH